MEVDSSEQEQDVDLINKPPHYTHHPDGIECVQVTEWLPSNLGQVIKYIWRAGFKPGNSVIQDLEKARFFLEREIGRRKKMCDRGVLRETPQDAE